MEFIWQEKCNIRHWS